MHAYDVSATKISYGKNKMPRLVQRTEMKRPRQRLFPYELNGKSMIGGALRQLECTPSIPSALSSIFVQSALVLVKGFGSDFIRLIESNEAHEPKSTLCDACEMPTKEYSYAVKLICCCCFGLCMLPLT